MKQKIIFLVLMLVAILLIRFSFNTNESRQPMVPNETQVSSPKEEGQTPAEQNEQSESLSFKDNVEENQPIEDKKTDVLYTRVISGGAEVEIIDAEYLDNGELAKETVRYPSGQVGSIRYRHEEERETGYSFHPMDHTYWQYEKDILLQMSEQNDGAAQYILAQKLEDKEKAKYWFLRSAENGYSAGFFHAARAAQGLKQKAEAYALYLLAEQTGPETHKRTTQIFAKSLKLSEQEIKIAKQKFQELKKKYKTLRIH
ncbi:MAG: hypothetical protein OQJ89_13545 [Kangiellaceae bacterium]|nr:hypothetical protein [Kangiellaceae bacterium]